MTKHVPSSAKTLRVSFVGMQSQNVAIKSGVMKIVLKPDAEVLDEVVVTAMGISRKQKSLGYATQQVKAEDLTLVRQTDLNNAIVGKVAGVRFLGGSGAKFDAGSIVLRGTTSISDAGGTEPIYVVDGVITNANSVNMDDVASINVLKGPAATAMYGSRGGNGAIIITTKGLDAGAKHTEINVSHTIEWEKPYIHAKLQHEYGGGYYGANGELDTYHYDAAKDPAEFQKLDGVKYYDYGDDASWGPRFDSSIQYAPAYAWDITSPYFGQTTSWNSKMDLKDLFDTGLTNTTNVSFARSGDGYMTRVSFTNSNRDGVQPNSGAVRRYLTFKTMFKPLKNLTVSLDYKYTYRKNHNAAEEGYGGTGNALYSYLQWGHMNVDLDKLRDYKRPDGTFRAWNIKDYNNSVPAYHNNPYALFNEINKKEVYQWNVFSGDAEYALPFNIKAGIRVNGNIRSRFYDLSVPENLIGDDYTPSKYEQEQSTLADIQVQGRLSWGGRFINDKLSIDAAAFMESRNYHLEENSVFTRDGLFLDGYFNTAASNGLPGGSNKQTKLKEQAVYGTATIGWDDTYYADLSLRNDWSSTLHPDNNSYLYGGASVSAILSNFFKNTSWLSFWKIRGSIAQVGSSINAYNIYPTYKLRDIDGNLIKYGQLSNMWYDTNLKNPYIKPTITTSYEIGMEFRLFNNRFWGDANFYNRDSKDQIINVTTSPASGYTSRKMNAGLIRNRGIELSLGGMPIKTKNWQWEINANISKNSNKLVKLAEGQDRWQIYGYSFYNYLYSVAQVGKPIGELVCSTNWARDDQGRLILQKLKPEYSNSIGEYLPKKDSSKEKYLGSVQPDWTGGFATSLQVKGFRLGASFDFQIGGKMASVTNMMGEGSGMLASTSGYNDRGGELRGALNENGGVRVDGVVSDGNGGYTPVTTYIDAQYYYQNLHVSVWEDYIYDASYLKMRELSLSYQLPVTFLKKTKTGIKQASVAFVATNPWLIYSAIPNIDPSETGGATYNFIEGGQAASTRSFGFSVNLTF